MPRRLTRTRDDRMLFGVSGGLGRYFDVDPVLIRVIWILLGFMTAGMAIIAYIVLAIVVPEEPRSSTYRDVAPPSSEPGGATGEAAVERRSSPEAEPEAETRDRRRLAGIVLIVLGVIFLAANFGAFFGRIRFDLLWPAVIIAIGLLLLVNWSRGNRS